MPLNSLQLHTVPPGTLTPGTTNDFISISAISCFHQDNQYGSCSQSTSCYNVIKPMNHLIAAEDLWLETECDNGLFYMCTAVRAGADARRWRAVVTHGGGGWGG